MAKKTETLHVRMTKPQLEAYTEMARLSGLPMDSVISVAMAAYLVQAKHADSKRNTAVDVLRQIADGKRRTREVMLARSCVTFLDSLAVAEPND